MTPLLCYRCRKILEDETSFITCKYCTVSWHIDCLIQPTHKHKTVEDDWRCPHHQERPYTRKRVKGENGKTVKIEQQQEEEVSFHEAEHMVKYGNVTFGLSTSHIEHEFLDYAKRTYRFNRDARIHSLPQKTHEQQLGVQMLLDAAHCNKRVMVELDEKEYEKIEAIKQLVRLKGDEDTLIKLLSQ
ncbi:uncharacterized protein B0P05DRAFT_564489 [Gilbertella persicaria]|uniref:uncharacterized protein n=1 Tax=Gilbertella persicaria TaxID=101096 RepID=UPI00221ED1D3|nr:uncharacterized protein B0P05DRAFT_564489 [Gilbertella persicaria]KAI8048327.1 hypothetical protein B0P05DRAFT_564489 [Gilbertella persicaria]